MPDNDVTATVRSRDLAVGLDAEVRGVDVRLGFPRPGGHGVLRNGPFREKR